MKKSYVTVILLIAMLSFCGCAGSKTDSASIAEKSDNLTEEATNTDTQNTEELFAADADELGDSWDFEGYNFKIFSPGADSMTWLNPVISSDEQNAEVINDAIYARSRAVEDRLNIKITESYGEWNIGAPDVRKLVNAGDASYDMITMIDRNALQSAADGTVIPFDKLQYVDISKVYWGDSLLDYTSIGGKNYFAFGDYALSTYDMTVALLFNQDIAENYKLEDIYALVESGNWTMDKFSELAAAVTNDLNGDGVMDENDIWGYISMPKQVLPGMWIGAGVVSITKDSADIPTYSMGEDEKFYNVFTKIFEITRDTNVWYENKIGSDIDMTLEQMFANNKGLFLDSSFFKITRLREMDTNFGIIPYPKYDDNQADYYSRVSGSNLTVIPLTNTELDRTSVILEAMASESRKTVINKYYDVALKGKYIRDEASSQMLDLIFRTRTYDLGDTFWSDYIRDNFISSMFSKNDRDLISNVAKNKTKTVEIMEKQITALINS